ncbi:hypothetical protein K440DRAFT_379784 [Wilcoxina mikolae CBS 423.85]|nr:hypothetical protein K440DRAFT_379784 [Wilcoxina mikolae CBS 423.85]
MLEYVPTILRSIKFIWELGSGAIWCGDKLPAPVTSRALTARLQCFQRASLLPLSPQNHPQNLLPLRYRLSLSFLHISLLRNSLQQRIVTTTAQSAQSKPKTNKQKTNIWLSVNNIFCSSVITSRCIGVSELHAPSSSSSASRCRVFQPETYLSPFNSSSPPPSKPSCTDNDVSIERKKKFVVSGF